MFVVPDTIFQSYISPIYFPSHFLDVAGVGFRIQVVAFPEPAG
jgi:hypothetical protein